MRIIFILLFFSSSAIAEECKVAIEVKATPKGNLEISLENKSSEVMGFAYHNLPWVVTGQGGVGFKIFIDNKQIPVARGSGNNNEVFRIWPKSKVSGIVDSAYVKFYYRDYDSRQVRIEWYYNFIPQGEFAACGKFSGDLSVL